MAGFIGRELERKIIESYCNSRKAEMVAIYGRRRVGKTFLVKEFFNKTFDFYFTGSYETPKAVQLDQFKKEIEHCTQKEFARFKDWFAAFDALRDYLSGLQKERIVVFLDELPWMDTAKSNFLAAFSYFWNTWGSTQPTLKLFVCGSSTTWMLEKLIGDKGGLYGRVSRAIYLAPFTLHETEKFLNDIKGMGYGHNQVLDTYMILGGIPYYLDMMDRNIPFAQNIDNLFFKPSAPLKAEFNFLFRSLFNKASLYQEVVRTLSTKLKGLTRQEIAEATHQGDGGVLTQILENLCRCDFIRKYSPFGKKSLGTLYQLTDMFSLFYLRFMGDAGQDENYWSNSQNSGEIKAWTGYAFEQVCLIHLQKIKERLGISGVLSNSYSWSCKPFTDADGTNWDGGQIDLLIDRADKVINVCEMKYSAEEYAITKDYEKKLRDRIALFKKVSKTKKAVTCVFVTTLGVRQNAHSGIVQHQITLDGLF
ncbi:MAG: ATP-binding protein [Fibrobacter sp.]|nr:ATP-binding protein [Fibrobacter sp.]